MTLREAGGEITVGPWITALCGGRTCGRIVRNTPSIAGTVVAERKLIIDNAASCKINTVAENIIVCDSLTMWSGLQRIASSTRSAHDTCCPPHNLMR